MMQRSGMSRVCSFMLATPQRGERLLDVPKRKRKMDMNEVGRLEDSYMVYEVCS
jgi:hypothetical protein